MKTPTISPAYTSLLDRRATERAISLVKDRFPKFLSHELSLESVVAPVFVSRETGLQDDLNGIERPVRFPVKGLGDAELEIVHSLAKWKRFRLGELGFEPGEGILTDMRALRPDEEPGPLHSIYVDQWDWEKVITAEDRQLSFLKTTVERIYAAIRQMEASAYEYFPQLAPRLPKEIAFVHAEDLQKEFPEASPKEREAIAAKKHGAVFIIGIGGELPDGSIHDGRAPDYDDWSTPTADGYKGLNGDIVLWHPELEIPFEISSMGIRVDAKALQHQLEIRGCEERKGFEFHQALLKDELPLTIGGGIGQSRMCMFLLRKVHIGEVQATVWPAAVHHECAVQGIRLM